MDQPVNLAIVDELEKSFTDYHRSYHEKGIMVEEFDEYGPTRRTLRQFSKATDDIVSLVRDIMLPNPDVSIFPILWELITKLPGAACSIYLSRPGQRHVP